MNSTFNELYKKKLLEAFEFTSSFLKKNGLKFYGCGGTVLGAVRHHGMIPWDDDIDLYMLRSDYDKLIGICNEMEPYNYKFVCVENDKNYYLPFGKVVNTSTTLLESKQFPYLLGIFIDIFPLDDYSEDVDQITAMQLAYKKVFHDYQKTIMHLKVSDISSLYELKVFLDWIISSKNKGNQYKRVLSMIQERRLINGKYCVCTPQWEGKIFMKEWFENAVEFTFEDTTILIPQDYDCYLTMLYGDYMTPPPKEQQKSNHSHYYLNLIEGLSLNEVKERIKRGETLVY